MTNAREQHIYKGISFPFRFGSNGGVVTSKLNHYDTSRIKESIHQIVLTFLGERVMLPNFGSNLNDYVFEIAGDETSLALLQHEMKKAIELNDDRVVVNSLKVFNVDEDGGTVIIEADIHIVKFVKNVQMNFEINLPAQLLGGV